MNNTQKDRFEKKLIRFIREWNKKKPLTMSDWQEFSATLYKKYGFSDEELHKACRLIRSWTSEENGLKKTKRFERKKMLRDRLHDVYRSDIADNPNGEAEIKAEDRWIADVFDTYDYGKEDMSR